ncbi:MAG TPA: hypothetical protein VFX96_00685 [Pyrinomonadaceae bacterium]|nr:hypothetical protein [Pyrinomonadaceae bacterium]
MKKRIFLALLLVAAAWLAGRYVTGRGGDSGGEEATGLGEIHEMFELQAGAQVEVRGINGPVTVETSETTTAEVHVTRTARDPGDSVEQKILIDHTPRSLVVRGENGGRGGWWRKLFGGGGRHAETRVTLKLPRRVEFEARGINGAVTVGETEGFLSVSGVNGRVEAKQAEGQARVTGTNGGVQLTFARVGQKGVQLSGVNGKVEFRLGAEAAADVDVHGINGRVSVTIAGATVEREQHGQRVRAKIGAGGPRVEVTGVNGSVNFDPAN